MNGIRTKRTRINAVREKRKLRQFALFVLMSVGCLAAEENTRQGQAKECFIYSWGKGPNWTAPVSVEFRLAHLKHFQPFVDERIFEPAADALGWSVKKTDPKMDEVGRFEGRRIMRFDYPGESELGQALDCVLLAIESEEESGWFAPFLVVSPERFEGRFISGKDVRFGYLATIAYSGTGAFRRHYLFDFAGKHPTLRRTVSAGRVRRWDYDTEEDYKEALSVFEIERELFRGGQVSGGNG